jgi:hypothetical protein
VLWTIHYSSSFAAKEMDIEVVLTRASELHAKINDAIERAMKSEFLQSTASVRRSSNSNMGGVVEAESGLLSSSPGFDGNEFDSNSYEGGGGEGGAAAVAGKGDANAEVRSLGSIRDALEVLEEQLKALQVTDSFAPFPFLSLVAVFILFLKNPQAACLGDSS